MLRTAGTLSVLMSTVLPAPEECQAKGGCSRLGFAEGTSGCSALASRPQLEVTKASPGSRARNLPRLRLTASPVWAAGMAVHVQAVFPQSAAAARSRNPPTAGPRLPRAGLTLPGAQSQRTPRCGRGPLWCSRPGQAPWDPACMGNAWISAPDLGLCCRCDSISFPPPWSVGAEKWPRPQSPGCSPLWTSPRAGLSFHITEDREGMGALTQERL